MKFIAGTGKSPEPHSLEAMVDFEVGKSHLNALAFVTRLEETLGSHQSAGKVASILVDVTRNFRAGVLGQHCILSAQTSQSNFEAR
jgi:hypothetical protein